MKQATRKAAGVIGPGEIREREKSSKQEASKSSLSRLPPTCSWDFVVGDTLTGSGSLPLFCTADPKAKMYDNFIFLLYGVPTGSSFLASVLTSLYIRPGRSSLLEKKDAL